MRASLFALHNFAILLQGKHRKFRRLAGNLFHAKFCQTKFYWRGKTRIKTLKKLICKVQFPSPCIFLLFLR
jgi:hypothetical protein